jgi:hypothetical protein
MNTSSPSTSSNTSSSSNPKINFKDFNPEFLAKTTAEKKEPKSTPGSSNSIPAYHVVPILYNYGTIEKPNLCTLQIEGPKFTTNQGLVDKEFGGRIVNSIPTKLSPTDPEHTAFIEFAEKLDQALCNLIDHNKTMLGMPKFKKNDPEDKYKPFLYYPKDKITKELIAGGTPSIYFKAFDLKFIKTRFMIPVYNPSSKFEEDRLVGKDLSWDEVRNVQMDFIPLFAVDSLSVVKGEAGIRSRLISAVVTKITSVTSVNNQMDTIKSLVSTDSSFLERIMSDYNKLVSKKEEELTITKAPIDNTGDSSTLSALTGDTGSGSGSDDDHIMNVEDILTQKTNRRPKISQPQLEE